MIITIVGGGSTFTPGIVKSIALRKEELEVQEIRLFDIDRERQDKVGTLVRWILEEDLKCGIKLTVTYDVEEAYRDADFIFAQMRVGKYAMRELDEKIPLRHGCVGQETCGCGGLAYGMRTIFPMIRVIDDAEKYAKPTHWILNYSNPASIVSEACRKLRPDARIINICDMPIAIIDVAAAALNIKDKENIVYDYYGLNHFGWFTGIEYKGEDVLPKLRDYIMEHEILLPEAYLKDKAALAEKNNDNKTNRHAKGSWYYVWKGVYEIGDKKGVDGVTESTGLNKDVEDASEAVLKAEKMLELFNAGNLKEQYVIEWAQAELERAKAAYENKVEVFNYWNGKLEEMMKALYSKASAE